MGYISLNNETHRRLVREMLKKAQAIDTIIDLPELNSNMPGLINMRNGTYKIKSSLDRFKEMIADDSSVFIASGNEITTADFYASEKIKKK